MTKFIRMIVLSLAIIIGGLGLTACSSTASGANSDYTGTAITQSHNVHLDKCKVTVEFPNGETHSYRIGRKKIQFAVCHKVKDGGTAHIVKGKLKKYDKK